MAGRTKYQELLGAATATAVQASRLEHLRLFCGAPSVARGQRASSTRKYLRSEGHKP